MCLYEGYRYRKDRTNGDNSVCWHCVHSTSKCSGKVKVNADGRVGPTTPHNHAPDEASNEVEKIKAGIRDRAVNTVEKPRQIIMQCTAGKTQEAKSAMPRYVAITRTIHRKRKLKELAVPTPHSLQEITLPATLMVTASDENFLLWDSGDADEHRILMFGTERNLQVLNEHRHWFIDGTFKVAPTLYYPLFTIHALIDHSALPMIYVLLPSKEEDYVRVFLKLLHLKPTIAPESLLADFEKALLNAAAQVFTTTMMAGCFFHLGQCLWRRIQEEGLATWHRCIRKTKTSASMPRCY